MSIRVETTAQPWENRSAVAWEAVAPNQTTILNLKRRTSAEMRKGNGKKTRPKSEQGMNGFRRRTKGGLL